MKILLGLLIATMALNVAVALPARSPQDDAEEIDVPRRHIPFFGNDNGPETDFRNFRGVVDTGATYPFLQSTPHIFSFNFDFIDDILRRLRTRLWATEIPQGPDNGSDIKPIEGQGGLIPQNGNTTSTVKVVDGHRVEVNETVYGGGDNVLRVRLVKIRPVEDGEDVNETVLTSDNGANTNNKPSQVTEGPVRKNPNSELDESNEREELDSKKIDDNEILRDIDEPEHKTHEQQQSVHNGLLPTTRSTAIATSIIEDDFSNLTRAFVTDNRTSSIAPVQVKAETEAEAEAAPVVGIKEVHNKNEKYQKDSQVQLQVDIQQGEQAEEIVVVEEEKNGYGNFKTETNKSEDDSNKMVELKHNESSDTKAEEIDAIQNEQYTIENNEESEVNDNFNESSVDDVDNDGDDDGDVGDVGDDVDVTSATETATTTRTIEADTMSSEFEFDTKEDVDGDAENVDELTKDLNKRIELIELSASSDDNDGRDEVDGDGDGDADVDVDGMENEKVESEDKNEREGVPNKSSMVMREREDIVSSDDESIAGDEIKMSSAFNAEWENLSEELPNEEHEHFNSELDEDVNDLSNDIDAITYDLSNDIAVNDIAAANADYPHNPDAEFIDVINVDGERIPLSNPAMPKFEKLSVGYINNDK